MARYKKKKSKNPGSFENKKIRHEVVRNKFEDNIEKNSLTESRRFYSPNNSQESEEIEKTSISPASDDLKVKKDKKIQDRVTDLSMLQSAISERNTLLEKNRQGNSSGKPNKDFFSQETSRGRSPLAEKKISRELMAPSAQPSQFNDLQSSSEMDDVELFRSEVERLSHQEIVEKKNAFSETKAVKKRFPEYRGSRGHPLKVKIDLHGLTVDEAKHAIQELMNELELRGGVFQVSIITGKGLHSDAGPVLASEIHRFVEGRFSSRIITIESSPMETMLGGIPLRGSFVVTLRF